MALLVLLGKTLVLLILVGVYGVYGEDLYKTLGVSRDATTKQIKKAYRQKALETHPDKQGPDKSPEQLELAAEAFRKVVHAFEVLTDEQSRRSYDRTGRDPSNGGQRQQRQQHYGGFRWTTQQSGGRNRWRPRQLKDKLEVKQAQARVMHIVSLEQLETVMLDDNDKLERNLLMIFVTPQEVETMADDVLVFPYPFAGHSTQGIWWEDMLQTVKIRYHKENDLTRFFGVPTGDELRASGKPIVLYGKRGQSLSDTAATMERIQPQTHEELEVWIWNRITVEIVFVNRHDHPVEIYWINQRRAKLMLTLEPGKTSNHFTKLSHEWWFRDARVDTRKDSPNRRKMTDNSSLGKVTITSDQHHQEVVIERKTCFDLSGHCGWWDSHGECTKNPKFMAEQCLKTCKFCSEKDDIKKPPPPPNESGTNEAKDEL